MTELNELIAGFERFQRRYFGAERTFYEGLVRHGQSPQVMVLACCDSRVDPAIITDCDPGDLFVVRNVANLVPPCESSGHYHGTSAAIEFAVRVLRVRDVVVLGHARCGGIAALMHGMPADTEAGAFIAPWMSIASAARDEVRAALPRATLEEQARACERAAVGVSLGNLMSFPFVSEAVAAGALAVHGWYFDMDRGELLRLVPERNGFEVLVGGRRDAGHGESPAEARS